MKKLFSLFSMLILLSSNALPAFTYADSGDNELAIQILTEEVNNVGELFTSGNEYNSEFIEVNDASTFSTNSSNQHIVHDEENGLITIYSEDFTDGITIKDKNVGANIVGTGEESYGNYYYYKNDTPVDISLTDDYDGLKTSLETRNNSILCNEGFHIPSKDELEKLIELYDIQDDEDITQFRNDLMIPLAGYKNGSENSVTSIGIIAQLHSSTPEDKKYGPYSRYYKSYTLKILDNPNGYYGYVRSLGTGLDSYNTAFPVRCFKNDYVRHPKTVTYYANGGYFSGGEINKEYTYNYSGMEIIPIYNIQIPDRISEDMSQQSGWMFAGWYTKDGTNNDWGEEFDINNPQATIAYAKWLPFNDLKVSFGDFEVTLLDRNLGAKEFYNPQFSPEGNYVEDTIGFYFQWGNNYGFKERGNNGEGINSKIDSKLKKVNNYGPGNYFYNNKFILNNSLSWLEQPNRNLWGNDGELDEDRKGPCPKGYHIPRASEFDKLITEYNKRKLTDEGVEYCGNYNFTASNYCFATKLHIPIAGYIGTNGKIYNKGEYLGLRTATTDPRSTINSRYMFIRSHDNCLASANSQEFISSAYPLRCIKNQIKKIIFETNGGYFENTPINITSGLGENASILPVPTKNDGLSIFKGWYTTKNYEENTQVTTSHIDSDEETIILYAKWECESGYTLSEDLNACNPNVGTIKSNDGKGNEINIYRYVTNNTFINNGYEFIGWNTQNDGNGTTYKSGDIINESGLVLYAQWKSIEEKAQETTSENVVYTNSTTVTVGDETTEEVLSGSSALTLVAKEVESHEVTTEEDTIKVQDSEIKVTSDKTVEYEGGLEVYLEKKDNVGTENETTGKIEGTIKFSAPVAVKISISSDAEYVKVQVKHYLEEFGYKGLTTNPINSCSNGEAVTDKYNGENILVTNNNGEKYALIYTCSASTFVAYIENVKTVVPSPASGGGRTITSTKQETKSAEQEHNSADLEKATVQENAETVNQKTGIQSVEEQVKKIQQRSLTRGEVAVMTNILLDVYPQLTENRELNEVSKACENYTDEQKFTKDEKKAITRLCKLSIMGIHADDNKPLDEFMVNEIIKNDEFSKVINRSLESYTEKDFSVVKDALKKLEGDEENVVFGTVYDVFMSIKNIFN